MVEFHSLNRAQTEQLLDRLNGWHSGICPDGTLAKTPSFVLSHIPNIVIHPDEMRLVTTDMITEHRWAENLLDCGAIYHLDDGIMMKALSDFYMLFHERNDTISHSNTLHSIQIRKHASFRVDHIYRPTRPFQIELERFLKTEPSMQWHHLLNIWQVFGYLWPRRIVVGYRTHIKERYAFKDEAESIHAYYHHINVLKSKQHSIPEPPLFDLDQFLMEGTIVSRLDLAPLHDFLDTPIRQAMKRTIDTVFVQIRMYHPIKLYNVSTNSYLCWDPKKKPQPDKIFKGETLDFIIRAVSADPKDLSQSPESQYLWRFTWFPASEPHAPLERQSTTVRGGDSFYIYPACKTPARHSASASSDHSWPIHDRTQPTPNYIDTHNMALTCCPRRYESEPPSLAKLKGLRLLSSKSPYYPNEKIDWTIEHTNSRLKYVADTAVHLKININEYLRRERPVLEDREIHLQQIGLLTSFEADVSSSSPSLSPELQGQSLRTAKKISSKSTKGSIKSNVLCVDEDITLRGFAQNSKWKIMIASKYDMDRHASHFFRWPQSNNDKKLGYPLDYHPILSQDTRHHFPVYLNDQTGSLASMATTNSSLRRSKSLGSIPDGNKTTYEPRPVSSADKTQFYEDLVNSKGTSKIISQFVKKVSLQPFTQLVKPSRHRHSHQQTPPPFSRSTTNNV